MLVMKIEDNTHIRTPTYKHTNTIHINMFTHMYTLTCVLTYIHTETHTHKSIHII